MPFCATDADTGKRVSAFNFAHSAEIRLKHPRLICSAPDCGCELYPRSAVGRLLHFVHKSSGCSTSFDHHPESVEHMAGKEFAIQTLKRELKNFAGIRFETEVPLKDAGEFGRIADVAVIFPDGSMEVHEIQLAAITVEDLARRTRDYGGLGIDVCWWLGKNALNSANTQWCLHNLGGYRDLFFNSVGHAS